MITGNITITCDKCGKTFSKEFASLTDKPAEVPSRDALINEFKLKTLWVEKEYMLCPDCGGQWEMESTKLTTNFQNDTKKFLIK